MRSLLHDYLATDGETSYRTGQKQTMIGSAFSRAPRDRNKRMFKLSDMDTKSSDVAQEREDLEFILRTSVPGLVSDSKRTETTSTSTSNDIEGNATGHKLLVEPSVFNMGILLPPSLEFLNRLKEVVPTGSDIVMSTLTSFLDDFLVNVFHPQLDETLVELCAQAYVEVDSYQEDPHWTKHSKRPIFKVCRAVFSSLHYADSVGDRKLPHSHLRLLQNAGQPAARPGFLAAHRSPDGDLRTKVHKLVPSSCQSRYSHGERPQAASTCCMGRVCRNGRPCQPGFPNRPKGRYQLHSSYRARGEPAVADDRARTSGPGRHHTGQEDSDKSLLALH